MSDRKKTPDILGSVLGGVPAKPAREPDIMPDPARAKAPARRSRKKAAPQTPVQTPDPKPKTQKSPAPKPATPSMRWEYQEVIFYDYGGYIVRYVNGDELPKWKRNGPRLSDYINRMGQDGWEMVGLLSPKRYHLLAIFKRPLTD